MDEARRPWRPVWGLVLGAVLAAPGVRAERIAVMDFKGPGAEAVRASLVEQLCQSHDCVPAARVSTRGQPDWKKARKEAVQALVTGAVAGKGKARKLTLQVLAAGEPPRLKRAFALDGSGQLPPRARTQAVDAIAAVLAIRPAVAAEVKPPPPAPEPPPPPPPPPTAAPPAELPPPPPAPEPEPRHPLLVVELGAHVLNRQQRYLGGEPGVLIDYQTRTVVAVPHGRVELNPFARGRSVLLGGLGLEVAFGAAPWLVSEREATAQRFPTLTYRLDAGLRWRLLFLAGYDLAFTPFVGFRLHDFTVGAAADGARLTQVPGITYLGLRAGLGVEVPLGSVLLLFGDFAVLPIFSAGQLSSADYFPSSSTLGLEAHGGLAVRFIPQLQLRLAFEYLSYGTALNPAPGATLFAERSQDVYLGGLATLRLQL